MNGIIELSGKRGLVVGIANEHSIAAGCAHMFRAAGAELAIIYLNEKTEPYVRAVAETLPAALIMACDVSVPGQLEAVFERIKWEWGKLDFVLHSIAFAPAADLHASLVDLLRGGVRAGDGRVLPFIHPHGEAGGAADERRRQPDDRDFLRRRTGGRQLQPDGSGQGRARIERALSGSRSRD